MESTTGTVALIAAGVDGIARVVPGVVAQATGVEFQSRSAVFEDIFLVFLVLGTIVGVIVISYSLYNAIKYRDDPEGTDDADIERPQLGELPGGGGGGRKLFVSFGMSAIIVVGLIAWTYGALLYVEAGPADQAEESLDVEVVGLQFAWEFHYDNGHVETGTLRVPVDTAVSIDVTSRDVWHTFGVPDLRVKADAIPGQTDSTWFAAEETGTYEAWCFELCGTGHSTMTAEVEVMEQDAFDEWYEEVGEEAAAEDGSDENTTDDGTEGTDGDEAEDTQSNVAPIV